MNLLHFARMVVAAQRNVVRYEHGATICPVCRELGLAPAKCTVTCTVNDTRYLTCSQCLSTFTAIGDEPKPKTAVKTLDTAAGESPKTVAHKSNKKHNKVESEVKDEKPKRNRKRTSAVPGSA